MSINFPAAERCNIHGRSVYFPCAWHYWDWMSTSDAPADLLDLKLLPAWVKEPAGAIDYSTFEGEEADAMGRGDRRPRRAPDRKRSPQKPRGRDRHEKPARREHAPRGREPRREEAPPIVRLNVAIAFLPHPPSLTNVVSQIKSGTVAYSVYAMARMFLEKPERYHVKLTAAPETPLFQLGERGPVSTDRQALENGAFAFARDDFYKVEVIQSEPRKGNFTNVARCRLSGILFGPTNHHSYQAQLRNLYEQRFSRRMSFVDYQRQIEVVSDPAAVEQWKEQARSITTFTTINDDPPVSFTSATEAERHFRQNYLPGLLRSGAEFTINGVISRRLADRALGRAIEDAWSHENRSPSRMMQELASAFRPAGLNIFRQRRNMLFVSPIRSRPFGHELTGVSQSIGGILATIAATPGIHRHDLAEKLVTTEAENGDTDRLKLTLASDLKWLISEGYVIEFNDGSLDLPRAKVAATTSPTTAPIKEQIAAAAVPGSDRESSAEATQDVVAATEPVVSSSETTLEKRADAAGSEESNTETSSEVAAAAEAVLSPSNEAADSKNSNANADDATTIASF